jgi:hypothetical protein
MEFAIALFNIRTQRQEPENGNSLAGKTLPCRKADSVAANYEIALFLWNPGVDHEAAIEPCPEPD